MAKLVITEGPDVGRSFPLDESSVTVGRGDHNRVQVTDLTVSREHFRIVFNGDHWRLLDLGSRNRTLVNGEPVRDHSLADGDRVMVGATQFLFVHASADTVPRAATGLDLVSGGFDNVTMELAGLLGGADRGASHLSGLYAFAEAVSAAQDLQTIYPLIAQLAREQCGAERAFLLVLDESDTLVEAARDPLVSQALQVSTAVVEKVVAQGKSVVVADIAGDQHFSDRESIVGEAIRSLMCAPVISRGRTLGILYVDAQEVARPFMDDDLRFLTALAQQAGIAVDNLLLREALLSENAELRATLEGRHDMVGEGEAIGRVLRFVGKVARTDSTVMLNGESGTGKELVARAIHRSSHRAEGPFVAVNCAALTVTLLESELFGHEKGAFTGATALKRGRFEMADGGTLFLDEVGELSLNCQTKFLRVLEEACFQRVGGTQTLKTNTRVVAATNRNLPQMVADGVFRTDLFYRLQVIQITLPGLRERRDDIPLLARHFVQRNSETMGRRIERIEAEALEALVAHDWPGNVRELKNAIERAMVLGEGPVLLAEDLPMSVLASAGGISNRDDPTTVNAAVTQPTPVSSLRDMEREAIVRALEETGGNKARAASLLAIDRSTLYKKIKDYDIDS